MIKTLADLLGALAKKECALLTQYKLEHGPMIGNMYEGLTRTLLDRAVFDGLDLHVVEGKIKNSAGVLSRQIDCMIVEGPGEKIPYTSQHLCDIRQVLAVVEVKKTLYTDDLVDSLELMKDVSTRVYEPHSYELSLARDSWVGLMGSELPSYQAVENLSAFEQRMFHLIMIAANLPLRVILGYGGFTTEHGLREGLVKHFDSEINNKGQHGLGPLAMANQIICGRHSIIKCDGMPYCSPIEGETWSFLTSSGENPLLLLIELLWTRLSYKYKVDARIFGEDLELEPMNRFLDATIATNSSGVSGWKYTYRAASKSTLEAPIERANWEPEVLTSAEFVILNQLCNEKPVLLTDPTLVLYLESKGTSIDELVASLRRKRLASPQSGRLTLLTMQCQCAILPDGRFIAGENSTGRLTRWVDRFMKARKPGSDAVGP